MAMGQEDESMYKAVSSLVEMLEPSDRPAPEDNKRTKEVIQKISSLITRMVEEEDQDGPAIDEDVPTVRMAETKRSMPNNAQTQLPHYPTPYELWQRSHVKPPSVTPLEYVQRIPRSERQARADQVTERLLRKQREEHFSMMKKQHKKLANELRGLTFAPDLKLTADQNTKYVKSYEPLYKRYNYEIERTNIKRTKMEAETRTSELSECSFKPDISRTTSSRKPPRDKSSVQDRCIKFGLERDMWAKQRRDIIERIELQSVTFEPKVNERSRRLYQKMKKEGRAVPLLGRTKSFRVKNSNKDAGHENDTFKPMINHRSERKKANTLVHERLYARAQKRDQARRKFSGKYMDTYIKGVNKPYWARNDELTASQTGMALGGVERSQLRERLTERGITTTPHVVSSRNYVNVIKYNPSYSFIYHKVMNEGRR